MPQYDASYYDPPAPVALVKIRPSDQTDSVDDVTLLIDTGADMTLLPRWAVARLGVSKVDGFYELVGFDGSRSTSEAVDLDVLFLNKAFRGRYLLTDSAHGVLGRDVLASCRLLFDGPAKDWSEVK